MTLVLTHGKCFQLLNMVVREVLVLMIFRVKSFND